MKLLSSKTWTFGTVSFKSWSWERSYGVLPILSTVGRPWCLLQPLLLEAGFSGCGMEWSRYWRTSSAHHWCWVMLSIPLALKLFSTTSWGVENEKTEVKCRSVISRKSGEFVAERDRSTKLCSYNLLSTLYSQDQTERIRTCCHNISMAWWMERRGGVCLPFTQ